MHYLQSVRVLLLLLLLLLLQGPVQLKVGDVHDGATWLAAAATAPALQHVQTGQLTNKSLLLASFLWGEAWALPHAV